MATVLRWAQPWAVAGDSAGGYLATLACLRLRDVPADTQKSGWADGSLRADGHEISGLVVTRSSG
ncbi:hypothetical protein AB0C02_32670, partial [Micromonospora sp. NPDC048999]|uniref:hypothetical protein n=1 Tax=Micromonospora sp. NPDC048999 TaxID=3155391 RepID=UPI0033E780B4